MKDYELTTIKKSDFKDVNGNYWLDGAFLGVSEPVKIVTPDPDKWIVGDKYFGEIIQATNKAGKPYNRFKRHQRPDSPTSPAPSFKDNDSIKAQFAIKAAVALLKNPEHDIDADIIEHWAGVFFDMVDRIKSHGTETKEPLRNWNSIGKDTVADVPVDIKQSDITYDDIPPIEAYG